jgi:hypothetical protein
VAAPDYQVLQLDLANARTAAPIIDVGTKYNAVVVQALPGGAGVSLHFGANKQAVPIAAGDSWEVHAVDGQGCVRAADEGLFMTNPIGAGTVVLVVSGGEVGIGRVA